jgi:raffinose/stachyose/melibiose transport system permease protein
VVRAAALIRRGPRAGGSGGRGRPVATGRPRLRWRTAAVFLLPALALYSIFIVYPLASALQYSLFNWRGTAQGTFAGLGNFVELATRFPLNRNLARAFGHNVAFFAGTMLVQNTLGLAFAVLLHRGRAGRRLLQTIYTLPYLVSPLVIGYLWSLLLNPTFGPVNAALRAAGLDALAVPWLGDPRTALPTVILVNAWQWIGFPMLLFGAAIAGIPEEYEQAARVDGASAWQVFRRVTLPLLTTAIGTVSVLTFVGNFNVFALVYAMGGSQGNPAGATDVLGLIFYRTAFLEGGVNAIGVSSALAVCMFAFIFGMSLLATSVLRRREAMLR